MLRYIHELRRRFDHGRSDFSVAVEIAGGALLLGMALHWLAD